MFVKDASKTYQQMTKQISYVVFSALRVHKMVTLNSFECIGGFHKRALLRETYFVVLLDFSLTVKAVPHECVIRTSQP